MRLVYALAAVLALTACDRDKPAPARTEPPSAREQPKPPNVLGEPQLPDAAAQSTDDPDAPDFVPPGQALIPLRTIDFAVYLPAPVTPELSADVEKRVKARFPSLTLLTKPELRPPPTVVVFSPDLAELPIPGPEDLLHAGRDLTPQQVEAVQRSKGALILAWLLDADPTYAELRKAQLLVSEVAAKGNGFVWDDITRELFSTDSWRKARIDGWQGDLPDARRHFATHYYETDGRHRAVTLGLSKLGLPDLVVQDLPPSLSGPMGALLGVVAQTLVEGGAVGAEGKLPIDIKAIRHTAARAAFVATAGPGAALKGHVTLAAIDPEEGDPDNRIAELRFDGYPGPTDADRQAAALKAIFASGGEKGKAAQ